MPPENLFHGKRKNSGKIECKKVPREETFW
jgi:hypothetical protein